MKGRYSKRASASVRQEAIQHVVASLVDIAAAEGRDPESGMAKTRRNFETINLNFLELELKVEAALSLLYAGQHHETINLLEDAIA